MKIFIGADHRGFELKSKFIEYLMEQGYEAEDMGAYQYESNDDYPDFALAVATEAAKDYETMGVLICGSSIGVMVAANKVKSIIATNPRSKKEAREDKAHHNPNVLCFSADNQDLSEIIAIFEANQNTEFEGDRHLRRINKILTYEAER